MKGLKVCRAGTRSFALPLVNPISTAHGPIASRAGFLVSLMDEEGRCGFGEATPLPIFGTEDLGTAGCALEEALGRLVHGSTRSFEEALAVSARACIDAPCALSALDGALHDLAAQRAGRSMSAWIRDRAGLAGEPAGRINVQALVVGQDAESVAVSAQASLDEGFETFKLKLAASRSQPGLELELVASLREVIGPARRIRLDANEAWEFREAEQALAALARFDIDYVEQPVAREDRAALKSLATNAAIPVAADEALLGTGWQACLESQAASIFVVKPAALGGIAAATALFRRARERGIRVVWSSLIDGAVSRATAVALAAGLGPADEPDDEVHGLGTAKLLARDLIEGCEVVLGGIDSNQAVGPGCDLVPVWEISVSASDEFWGEVRIFEEKR